MNKIMTIWNRTFDLPIEVQSYSGMEVTDKQKEVIKLIQSDDLKFDDALSLVKEYVYANNNGLLDTSVINNIFKYVMPSYVYVPYDTEHCTYVLMCDYKFDIEHGISILYEDGVFKSIGSQDEVL